jgi:ABC-2 type transport system permease protein
MRGMLVREAAGGSIYDLGYRHYDGRRLGRRHAVWAVYEQSLRLIFGIGRPLSSKIGPWLLTAAAYLPAVVQLGIASISTGEVELVRPEEYYTYIQIVLAIFIAVVAPELAGRDQRTQTLSLYFSRAIVREDYAVAKYAALVTAMLGLTLGPQLVLFLGNGVALDDLGGYIEDEWTDVPAAAASALLVCLLFAGIGLAIASQTSRRAYSTIAIIALFVISSVVGVTIVETVDGDAGRHGILISQFHIAEGLTYFLFGATPEPEEPVASADIWGGIYALAAVGIAAVCLAIVLHRYRSIQA